MSRLPLIATLFMAGIIFNCLRQLMNYSLTLTHQVLVTGAVAGFVLAALVLAVEIIAYRRARRSRGTHHEA
ncbi:hypothetical protein [Pantoea cypripedii]|uniref:Uncharacterized protein n=1 Tax=Pantoea cypripedii TaxID=55209 RepID=A0A1X1EMA8_PANCY|nr:hypothetical protein [Pantoea cypripedii]MBP2200591.1 putative membrane protein [Pantoea cypripedii]ORM90087.1 hypothetical protein HA50_26310 [Pantoea cypripedii]